MRKKKNLEIKEVKHITQKIGEKNYKITTLLSWKQKYNKKKSRHIIRNFKKSTRNELK